MGTRRTRRLAAGATLAGLLVSAPVVATAAGQTADPGGQPPQGNSAPKTTDVTSGTQPAAGASAPKTTAVVPGQQPVNADPQGAGPPVQLQQSNHDAGVKDLAPTKDRGAQNLPAQGD